MWRGGSCERPNPCSWHASAAQLFLSDTCCYEERCKHLTCTGFSSSALEDSASGAAGAAGCNAASGDAAAASAAGEGSGAAGCRLGTTGAAAAATGCSAGCCCLLVARCAL